ncbi:ribosomal-protein-alanine N-acetyltransferase [Flavobacterium sp. PL11]|uniref:GNAT family N-acetyltransferase n=1 Tax=Flavobacterium sp. PL11 TaxID=3071717 RepID=UPI002E0CAA11|nr:ribosomal-protein-alanine N-acetyltransferase [Flavobacterium sp. PL11]
MLSVNFSPFHNLETKRLLLRRVNNNDVKEVLALRSNPETMKFIPRPLLINDQDALAHIAMIDFKIDNNEGINWAITLKGSDKLIGLIGHYRIKEQHYRAEIGYMILPEYNGKGIVTEAVNAAVIYGFDVMHLHSIEAIIQPANLASAKVLEKSGFVKEAHLKENEYYDGRFIDSVIYSIVNIK